MIFAGFYILYLYLFGRRILDILKFFKNLIVGLVRKLLGLNPVNLVAKKVAKQST